MPSELGSQGRGAVGRGETEAAFSFGHGLGQYLDVSSGMSAAGGGPSYLLGVGVPRRKWKGQRVGLSIAQRFLERVGGVWTVVLALLLTSCVS